MINIGVIGGGLGLRCLIPKFLKIKGIKIMAFMSNNFERAWQNTCEYEIDYICKSIEEMCKLPLHLICIASPTKNHFSHIDYILKNDIGVLCEKPLGVKYLDSIKIINLFENTKQITLIDLELRFNPYFIKMKELIKQIGCIYHIDMFFHSDLYLDDEIRNSWNYCVKEGGGIRLAIMPHFLDLLFFLFDKECNCLQGYLNSVTNAQNISDFCHVTLELEGNITVNLSATAVLKGNKGMQIKILASGGIIEFDLVEGLRMNGNIIQVCLPDYYEANESIFRNSFECYAREITQLLRGEKIFTEITSIEQMKRIHLLLEDIKISANLGQEIIYKENRNKNS